MISSSKYADDDSQNAALALEYTHT